MKYKQLLVKITLLIIIISGISALSFAQRTPLTIEMALDIAEENNPQTVTSKLNLERTRYSLEAQRASLKSQFSMTVNPFGYSQGRNFDNSTSQWFTNTNINSSGVFRITQPILLTDGQISLINTFGWQENRSFNDVINNSNKAFSNDLQLRFTQPLFTYNRQKMAMKRLEHDYENAGISYALQRLSTESRITNQFYSVFIAQKNLEISHEELANAKSNYEIIKSKVNAELSAREELFQAEVNLARAESSVESGKVSLDNAKDNLKQTLGIPLSEDIDVIADIKANPILINLHQAIQSGMNSRMELRQREINIEETELRMLEIKAMNEFSGNISLSLGIVGDNERLSNVYNDPVSSPRVAISFNVPIFDWGERKARIKAQQTAQTIAKLDYDNQVTNIELNIRQTLRNLNSLLTQIKITEKQVENTQRTYDLNLIKYREGDITGMDINQFQTQLSSAKVSQLQALINYKTELLNMKILTLYDFEKDKAIIPVMGLD